MDREFENLDDIYNKAEQEKQISDEGLQAADTELVASADGEEALERYAENEAKGEQEEAEVSSVQAETEAGAKQAEEIGQEQPFVREGEEGGSPESIYDTGRHTGRRGKGRKKPSLAKRIAGITAAAALFGVVAGGVMVGTWNLFGAKHSASAVLIGKRNAEIARVDTAVQSGESVGNAIGDVSEIVAKAMPSVVAINTTSEISAYTWFGRSQSYESSSSGSGIIIGTNAEELLLVTNNHVVENTSELSVVFIDGTEAKASVKGGDSATDIAVISVKLADLTEETKNAIEVATLGDSDSLKVGEGVVAIGNALGYGQSVTVGYISALNRELEIDGISRKLLQTDAAINPGNSGGALVNARGELIAINSAKFSSTSVEGMGYAIPINEVQDLIAGLSQRESRDVVAEEQRGYLGIQGQTISAQMAQDYDMPQGTYIYRIVEGGAAASSDLQEKDIITGIDGQSITSMQDLKLALSYYKAGEQVSLQVQRLEGSEFQELTIQVTLRSME